MKAFLLASAGAAALWRARRMPRHDNLQKLGTMQSTGTGSEAFEAGRARRRVRRAARAATSRTSTLPDGFSIDLFAVVPDARHMAVGPQGIATFVGTRKETVWAITDRNKDRVADEVKRLRAVDPRSPSRTASASPRTASSSSPSRTAC